MILPIDIITSKGLFGLKIFTNNYAHSTLSDNPELIEKIREFVRLELLKIQEK